MRWIALHLPQLSLESFTATLPAGASAGPIALTDGHRILKANPAARSFGVKPGMQRATALTLAPLTTLAQADAARDAQALTAVAHAALAFTPSVAIHPADARFASPHTVLIEVQASLRYFGGEAALRQRLLAELAPLGHQIHHVTTPTPLAAASLARVHADLACADLADTEAALAAAPVWLFGPGREHWEALQGMGLRTVADLLCMPRFGVARRFGQSLLDDLDRALGRQPDPREPIVLPPTFDSRLELFARADTTDQLLHGASVLLARLIPWLAAQHAYARRFRLLMLHEPRSRRVESTPAATTLEVALAEPSRDLAHLMVLLRERLANLPLPAPTLELRLQANDIAQRAPPNTELFPTPRSEREGIVRLIERLQARLGPEQIQRIVAVQDHRPERATEVHTASLQRPVQPLLPRAVIAPLATDSDDTLQRPVWLLTQPEALRLRAEQPLFEGRPLNLLCGPERIESGWWDGDIAERDYFIAATASQALVWVFRSRVPLASGVSEWFLQGRFG